MIEAAWMSVWPPSGG